ncbi:MAG: riboflavin kinase [Eisenbergiella massiliensis]
MPPDGMYLPVIRRKQTTERHYKYRLPAYGEQQRPDERETYLYDFNEEIYGEYVEVSLYSFCRPEMKFSSVEELKQNMARDIEAGREYWKNRRL